MTQIAAIADLQWKPVRGWTGYYEVSNTGLVKSLQRVIMRSTGSPQTVKERILKTGCNADPYPQVRLSRTGKAETWHVHILVAKAFLKKPKGADRVCHKDDVPSHNKASNLYWGNSSTNTVDAYANGKKKHKIPKAMIAKIRKMRGSGYTQSAVAAHFCISRRSVHNIEYGQYRFSNKDP